MNWAFFMPQVGNVDIVFKEEYTKLVAVYSNQYGLSNLELIEDAIQDAFFKALKLWPVATPDNPKAWIRTVSKNSLIDKLRAKKDDYLEDQKEMDIVSSESDQLPETEAEIKDDKLKMIFACCHPDIKVGDQLLLSLKYLCGFGNRQIARALLKSNTAIEKAVNRARGKFQSVVGHLNIPAVDDLVERLEAVIKVIYLQFTEGYKLSEGKELVNKALCIDAIKLAELLASYPALEKPQLNAVLALMYFQASRLDSRLDTKGNLLTLEHQDRGQWNYNYILQGNIYLSRAAAGQEVSLYHLEAAIASYHSTAATYKETNWAAIEDLYDLALAKTQNPNYFLNRLIARSYLTSADQALKETLGHEEELPNHHYSFVFLGDLFKRVGKPEEARRAYGKGLLLVSNELEKAFINSKIDQLAVITNS